jgi:hypothetical protein
VGVHNGPSDVEGAVDDERDSWGSDSDSVSSSSVGEEEEEDWRCWNLEYTLVSSRVAGGVSGEGGWGGSRGGRAVVIIDGEKPPGVGAT